MEIVKKFQYSLILFVISITIFLTGLLPSAIKLTDRYLLNPEDYRSAKAVITEMKPHSKAEFEVFVRYFTMENSQEAQIAKLDKYIEGHVVGGEIQIIYRVSDPTEITQMWNEWSQFFTTATFTMLGLAVSKLMMKPASPHYEHRKPKSLRERLEQYK